MDHGDYISFRINWGANEMQVCEMGPVLSQFYPMGEKKVWEITPIVHVLECLTKLDPQQDSPYRYRGDLLYDRERVVVKIHCTNDFNSVVDVPRERLRVLLARLLTPRETQVATLLFEGRTIRCIAAALHIAEGTVKRIIFNIYRKLGVGSQVELVREIYARLAQLEWTPGKDGQ